MWFWDGSFASLSKIQFIFAYFTFTKDMLLLLVIDIKSFHWEIVYIELSQTEICLVKFINMGIDMVFFIKVQPNAVAEWFP